MNEAKKPKAGKNLHTPPKALWVLLGALTLLLLLLTTVPLIKLVSHSKTRNELRTLQNKQILSEQEIEKLKKSVAKAHQEKDLDRKNLSLVLELLTTAGETKGSKVEIPEDFARYINEDLGFAFHYPIRWGEVQMESRRDCRDPAPDGVQYKALTNTESGFSLTFSNLTNIQIGALTSTCVSARGGGPLDDLWQLRGDLTEVPQDLARRWRGPASETRDLGGGKKLAIWYAKQSYIDYYLMASAGLTENNISPGIGFVSPPFTYFKEPSEETIEQRYTDITDFLTMVRSFELIP